MKFGRYLEETQTPEWKRAYIDYRACKKAIKKVVRRMGQGGGPDDNDDGGSSSDADADHGPSAHTKQKSGSSIFGGSATRSPGVISATSRSRSATGQSPSQTSRQGQSPAPAQTPASALSRSNPMSPHYGSTHDSPRTGGTSTHGLPPLDLGEPSMEREASQMSQQPMRPVDRMQRRTTGKGSVNFSPNVQAIPHRDTASPSGQASPKPPSGLGIKSPDSPDEIGQDTEAGGATTDSNDSKSPLTKSPSAAAKVRAGFNPKTVSPKFLSPRSPKVQATIATTTIGSPKGDMGTSRRSIRSLGLPSPRIRARTGRTFEELYATLEQDEKDFFDLLDGELEKVQNFYQAREDEAKRRAHEIRDQLRELAEHRRVFHELYPNGLPEWEARVGRVLPGPHAHVPGLKAATKALHLRNPFTHRDDDSGTEHGDKSKTNSKDSNGRATTAANGKDGSETRAHRALSNLHEHGSFKGKANYGGTSGQGTPENHDSEDDRLHHVYDPDRYQKYKKELRTAVLDFYHHLELIKNYRIMNLTGFRKALKKFEKATKIVCLELYTDDRIIPESFSHGEAIDKLIKEMEDLFTEHFEHGDAKKARGKLRQQTRTKTHYQSVFRSGLMIGLGLPPAILALVKSGEAGTQAAIPPYAGLLQVYAALYLPVLFAMLFELNLDAWVNARINYEFVMELSSPTLDFRSYLEIPSFLFLTLNYCFFFSFYRVSPNKVAPTTWPAAWLVFVAVFFLNPLPMFRRHSRYWFLRVLGRVCTPGWSRVEFIAFFIADELNSLTYSIQTIYFTSCAYANHWPDNIYSVCPAGASWPYALLLCLPALCRLIQCLKRYKDSELRIHLVNAGKYLSSISQFILFVWWRSNGSPLNHASFIVWVIFATLSSAYTSTWDLVVDWSLFRPGSQLLRPDLGYGSKSFYYFAMVTNVIIRFVWVWYIPMSATHTRLRSFIFALCEMLRRFQWNFFRVETEHLGNADAYRVTREIPLPYRRAQEDTDEDDDKLDLPSASNSSGSLGANPVSVQLDRMKRALVGGGNRGGRGPDELNVGPRGHAGQREYEGSRPGDEIDAGNQV